MRSVGVIPARYGSTRLKGKVLADIFGKPLIQHVWERAKKAKLLDDLIIAVDDDRVQEICAGFGAHVVMTDKKCASGSDRIAQAIRNIEAGIVVNIQGDEPMLDASIIDGLVDVLAKEKGVQMSTVVVKMTKSKDALDPNVVKAIVDRKGNAIYFSRSPIPFDREGEGVQYFKHLGFYGYRKSFLLGFKDLPKSSLEQAEKLEQLRVIEAGYKIRVIETEFDTIAVDTQEDLIRVKKVLKKSGGV
ncbi:MAG: 3-deoxy-manno-octulosonate cytidylyltransferase [Candidatus Omnitrophica bacterium]|nr:3-deoxy-manno-octulosonate cytidylyltransferase [Candidatus Omnitrophota bacterium]